MNVKDEVEHHGYLPSSEVCWRAKEFGWGEVNIEIGGLRFTEIK